MSRKLALLLVFISVIGLTFSGFPQIGESKQEKEIQKLITELGTRNWDGAVQKLAEIGIPAVEPLLTTLRSHIPFSSARACYVLTKIGTSEAVRAVMEALRDKNTPAMIREYAALALADVPSDESVRLLSDVLGSRDPWRTRMFASETLGKIGSDKAVGVLTCALSDESLYVRGSAAESLGEMKAAAAAANLVMLLKDESDFVRLRARTALVEIGKPAVDSLLQTLGDADSHCRWTGIWILGNMGTETAVKPLIEALEDPDWMVREEAALALRNVNSGKTTPFLIDLLKHERLSVREEAAWVLGAMKSGPAVDALIRALKDRESGWMAAAALGEIQSEKALEDLAGALFSDNVKLRRAAAWALGEIRLEESVAPLVKALDDKDGEVRMWAAAALENISLPQTFTVSQLQEDFRQMREIMEAVHPAMYAFTDKETFDRFFNEQYALINRPLILREFYLIAAPLVVRIGCGHSKLDYPESFWQASSRLRIPLRLIFRGEKAYVQEVVGGSSGVLPGSEILSINGRPMARILETFRSTFSIDGRMESYRGANLDMNFPFHYARRFGFPDVFDVVFRLPGESGKRNVLLQGVDRDAIGKAIGWKPFLGFEIFKERSTAVIKINSFVYYTEREKFNAFVDSAFQEIKELNTKNLILDFRGNFGGDPFCAAHLFSYIIPGPLSYFSEPYGRYARLAEPVAVAKNAFKGNIYILIDGWCFSTAGHLCALLEFHGIGTFVGEETGATYTCNDDKRIDHLKNTGLGLQLARGSFAAAVGEMPRDRGIFPDYPVRPTVQDLISGKDPVLETAFHLIEKGTR